MSRGEPDFDPFQELQLAPDAEPELIKAAFKALAKKYHPDRFQNPEEKSAAEARMRRINEAQRRLLDGEYRPSQPSKPKQDPADEHPDPVAQSGNSRSPSPKTARKKTPYPKKESQPLAFWALALLVLSLLLFLGIGPWLSERHYQRAVIYYSENRESEALSQLNSAVNRNPRNGRAYLLRAEIYTSLGEHDKAEIDLQNTTGLLGPAETERLLEQFEAGSGDR